jgi:hypothetical protein
LRFKWDIELKSEVEASVSTAEVFASLTQRLFKIEPTSPIFAFAFISKAFVVSMIDTILVASMSFCVSIVWVSRVYVSEVCVSIVSVVCVSCEASLAADSAEFSRESSISNESRRSLVVCSWVYSAVSTISSSVSKRCDSSSD